MENLEERLSSIILAIIAIAICGVAFYMFEFAEDVYYTQIDNTKIEKVSSDDDMKYKYTLKCYKENGKEKELTFKTSRELREDAYLKLETRSIGGVHSWEEVQYNELPEKVKANYTE